MMDRSSIDPVDELSLIEAADTRARAYIRANEMRRVFPSGEAIENLGGFREAFPDRGRSGAETIALLDELGSPATVASNGPNYFGFVIGASLPAAAAAERLVLAWDQCALSNVSSPVCAELEQVAAEWVIEALDLPAESAVGFGTSATACALGCLAAARRTLLARRGWDLDRDGLMGAPHIRAVVSELAHVTVLKALRILGFGTANLIKAPVDDHGRVDPARLPALDDMTILCLQAGEVNTGEFDPFAEIVPKAKAAGAWVHVDGAFGLWARASSRRALTAGVEEADSWTVDGHKWLNTPYDGAMAICRDAEALAQAMNSDAVYAAAAQFAQKNLTLEFSRRARGVAIWAALRTLGRDGIAEMIDRHCRLARHLADRLEAAGLTVLNRVVLNQVLVKAKSAEETARIREAVQASGKAWFGPTVWKGEAAFRISISSWRTEDKHVDALAGLIIRQL